MRNGVVAAVLMVVFSLLWGASAEARHGHRHHGSHHHHGFRHGGYRHHGHHHGYRHRGARHHHHHRRLDRSKGYHRHHGWHRAGHGSVAGGGLASWYGGRGRGLTAAHRTLPLGTRVLVTNRANGRSVVVRITDRGPFIRGRVIDLNRASARAIGVTGVSPVSLRRL